MASLVSVLPALIVLMGQGLLAASGPSVQRAQQLAATRHTREAMREAKASAELESILTARRRSTMRFC